MPVGGIKEVMFHNPPKNKTALGRFFCPQRIFIYVCLVMFALGCSGDKTDRSVAEQKEDESRRIQMQTGIDPEIVEADSLVAKGEAVLMRFKIDSARVIFEQAGDIYLRFAEEKNDSVYWAKYLITQNHLINILRRSAKTDEAFGKAKQLLKLGLEKLGPENQEVARIYDNISVIFWQVGELDSAFTYGNLALEKRLAILPEDHPDLAKSYNNLAIVYWVAGQLDTALALHQRALAIRLDKLDKDHLDTGISYSNIGLVYWYLSDYDNAIDNFSKALEITRLYGNAYVTATIYNNIAEIYRNKGDFHRALETRQRSFQELQSVFSHDHYQLFAKNYEGMATIYHGLDEIDRSIYYHHKAIRTWTKTNGPEYHEIAIAYMNLGNIYNSEPRVNLDSALYYYQKALDIRLKTLPPGHPGFGQIYVNMGNVYLKKNDLDRTEKHYEQAREIFQESFPPRHENIGAINSYFGNLNLQKKNYREAFRYFQKAFIALVYDFEENDIHSNPPLEHIVSEGELGYALYRKAKAFMKFADEFALQARQIFYLENALSTFDLAIELLEKRRRSYRNEGSKLRLSEGATALFGEAMQCSNRLFELTGQFDYREKMFVYAEKARAGILLEQLYESEAKQFAGIPPELLEEERTLRIDLTRYHDLYQQEKLKKSEVDSVQLKESETRYLRLREEYETLQETFEKNYPRYYTLKYQSQTVSLLEIQNALDGQTTALEYFLADSLLYIFVIDKTGFDVKEMRGSKHLAEHISQLLTTIDSSRYEPFVESSRYLYQTLIEPVQSFIEGKKLLIIPDGSLNYLPFETLLSEESHSDTIDYQHLPYLLKRYPISYAYSASLWLETQRAKKSLPEKDYLAFAPVFRDSIRGESGAAIFAANRSLDSTRAERMFLAASLREVEGIEKLFQEQYGLVGGWFERLFGDKTRIYVEDQASEQRIKEENTNQYRCLHFATHGFANKAAPELSGLLFSDDPQSPEDGVLRSGEIYTLQFNADLVVISACESAVGKLSHGEGLLGLTRAFLYAGARNLLVSLWKVNDASTADLMVGFYKNMLDGKSKVEALREAKLQLMQNNPDFAKPYHWASFILIGQ